MDRIRGRYNEILRQLLAVQINDPEYQKFEMRQTLLEELLLRHKQLIQRSQAKGVKRLGSQVPHPLH